MQKNVLPYLWSTLALALILLVCSTKTLAWAPASIVHADSLHELEQTYERSENIPFDKAEIAKLNKAYRAKLEELAAFAQRDTLCVIKATAGTGSASTQKQVQTAQDTLHQLEQGLKDLATSAKLQGVDAEYRDLFWLKQRIALCIAMLFSLPPHPGCE